MTRLEPSLWLKRLVVARNGHVAYDEEFRTGVNIIRGTNGSGKSTIADLIFFSLGGDVRDWKDESASCDTVYAEVSINGGTVTLRRDIADRRVASMAIRFGDLVSSLSTGIGWQRYEYARHGDKLSFTQQLFEMLGIPEVPGEAGTNITMHQLLRLMYVDQMTGPDHMFREEDFDSPYRRQAIGDLMCGVLDHRIYEGQLQLRAVTNQFNVVSAQVSSLYSVLNQVEDQPAATEIDVSRDNLVSRRTDMLNQISALKERRTKSAREDGKGKKIIADLLDRLEKLNRQLTQWQLEVDEQRLEIADADALIAETQHTLRAMDVGRTARETLGPAELSFCPSCFQPLTPQPPGVCGTCKSPLDKQDDKTRFLRMRNELNGQLKESMQLQSERQIQIRKLLDSIERISAERETTRRQFLSLSNNYVKDVDTQIDHLTSQVGYIDREIEDLSRKRRLATQLESLSKEKFRLNSVIADLQESVKKYQDSRDRRQGQAYGQIQSRTADILALDIQSEAEFATRSHVMFDFAADRININGKRSFSASSMTIIRNAFHLAILWASASDKVFVYPRFLLMDSIEDKGMTQERSRNFQRRIVEISKSIADVEHQIIFMTSMIDPQLEKSSLVVGERYTFNNKSLKFGPSMKTLSDVLAHPPEQKKEEALA